MGVKQDDRTPEQRKTHTYLVGGRDRVLSGWGLGKRGSWAFWACREEDAQKVTEWVSKRTDIIDQTWYRNNPPSKPGHVCIYAVHENHPALTD